MVVIVSTKPVHSTSSELADSRPPAQEGKQTSKEYANTSESLRSNQALERNVIAMEGPKHEDTIPKVVLLSIRRAQNDAVGMRGRISARSEQGCSLKKMLSMCPCLVVRIFFKTLHLL